MDVRQLIAQLPLIPNLDLNHDEIKSPPHHFVDSDGILNISAEHGDFVADYYGEFRGGCPWICPELEEFAAKNNMIWQWVHPGAIALYPN